MTAPEDQEGRLRADLMRVMRRMAASGLNKGASGNASVRLGGGMLITPSGLAPDLMDEQSIVRIEADGTAAPGALRPSSEWEMHWRILRQRSDVDAVVHCHSRHATILACCHKPIEPVHYMVSVTGGAEVPVAPYRIFGTPELADAVITTLGERLACLMANHGQIALGRTLDHALAVAEEVEEQAAVYYGALLLGSPRVLSEDQMKDIFFRFKDYGQSR